MAESMAVTAVLAVSIADAVVCAEMKPPVPAPALRFSKTVLPADAEISPKSTAIVCPPLAPT